MKSVIFHYLRTWLTIPDIICHILDECVGDENYSERVMEFSAYGIQYERPGEQYCLGLGTQPWRLADSITLQKEIISAVVVNIRSTGIVCYAVELDQLVAESSSSSHIKLKSKMITREKSQQTHILIPRHDSKFILVSWSNDEKLNFFDYSLDVIVTLI